MKSSSRTLAFSLLAGFAVGAVGVWSFHHFRSGSPSHTTTVHTSVQSSAPTLILPPLLAGAEADAALDAYLALPPLAKNAPAADIEDRLGRLRALLTLLPDTHFPRLFAALATRPGNAETQLRRLAFDVWTERDAPAAARWAIALVPGEAIDAKARTRYATQAALDWARDDFSAAYAWVAALPDANLGRDLAGRLLVQLAATDPRQALALARARGDEFFRATQVGVFQAWAQRDPAAALRALGPSLFEQQDDHVQKALAKWTALDPSAALDWMLALPRRPGNSNRSILGDFTWNIAETPDAVRPFIELLTRREDVPDRMDVVQDLCGAWARQDAAGALAWINTLTDVAQRSDLVTRAMRYIDQDRPDEFIRFARLLPESADREQKISGHLCQWAESDPGAALAWLAKNNDPELATTARRIEATVVATLAKTDPAAALARWQALPADSARGDIAAQLATHWSQVDPAAATRWFAQQLLADPGKNPADRNDLRALQNVAARWARQDPLGLVEWSESLPSAIPRERVINSFGITPWSYYRENEPDPPPRAPYANQLAEIKDPVIRERALSAHLWEWMRSDLQAARAWIESSEALSPEAAARLLSQGASTN